MNIVIQVIGAGFLLLLIFPLIYALILKIKRKRKNNWGNYFPPITIIIPAHNEQNHIRDKIDSILKQSYPTEKMDILVIDDGSDDHTYQLATPYVPQIRLKQIFPGKGKIAAINLGLELSQAELVVITDADTVLEKNSLENLIAPFQNPEIGAVSGRLRIKIQDRCSAYENAYVEAEHSFRDKESQIASVPFLFGQLAAFRRINVPRVQAKSAVDDIEIALSVIANKGRVIHSASAIVYETAETSIPEMLEQKTRRGLCTIEVVMRHLNLLSPRQGFFALTFFTRRVLPLFLPAILIGSFLYLRFLSNTWWLPAGIFFLLGGISWLHNKNLTEYMTLMQLSVCKSWWRYLTRSSPTGANWKSSQTFNSSNSQP